MGAPIALIVDGDWRMRKLIRTNLEAYSLHVVEAPDAREGLLALEGMTIDLLLLSAELPDANGWNVVCRLRRQIGDQVPIIVIVPEPANSRLLRRFRRVSQLLKPFSARTLLASVDQALGRKSIMHKMTENNLLAAFAGESQAHMRYLIFAERARKEGFANVARLFEAIAFAEKAHATNHLRELGQVKGSSDNLQTAIDGETFEVLEMYPVYHNAAVFQDESGAQRSTTYALEAEKIHAVLYGNAKKAVADGKDIEAGAINICEVCGHTVMGDAPDRCPVCGAPKARFRAF